MRAADATKRAERGQEIDRLQNVRLALGVVTEKQVEARRKIDIQPRVIAEVTKSQVGQMHAARLAEGTLAAEENSRRASATRGLAHVQVRLVRLACRARSGGRGSAFPSPQSTPSGREFAPMIFRALKP
jgi:hypothetical protein